MYARSFGCGEEEFNLRCINSHESLPVKRFIFASAAVMNIFPINDLLLHQPAVSQNCDCYDLIYGLRHAQRRSSLDTSSAPPHPVYPPPQQDERHCVNLAVNGNRRSRSDWFGSCSSPLLRAQIHDGNSLPDLSF